MPRTLAPKLTYFFDEIRSGRVGRARHANEIDCIARDRIRDRHHADELLEAEDLFGCRYGLGLRNGRRRGQSDDLHFVFRRSGSREPC